MKRTLLTAILLSIALFPKADAAGPAEADDIRAGSWAVSLSDHIMTPRIIACDDWTLPPVIELDGDGTLEFSFDGMSHDMHRYTYHIVHCDAGWEASDLLYSEYMDGFDNEYIDSWEISQNTTFEYTHYSLSFPNGMNRPKLSGNYMLSVLDDDIPVAQFRFCVVEPLTELKASASSITDIDTRGKHQQVVTSADLERLQCHNPKEELKLTVMQNLRFDNAASAVSPDFVTGSSVSWQHCEPLIFPAGNGFRRFEITDVYTNMRGVERIAFDKPHYHAYLTRDMIRRSFSHDDDHHGLFYIRSTETGAGDYDTESDYVVVHFTLDSPELDGGSPYLFFQYDAAALPTRYRMEYNDLEHSYSLEIPMKTGVYDYQYLWVPDSRNSGETGRIEGDWYETSNSYLILLYQRRPGERYDRLVSTSSRD